MITSDSILSFRPLLTNALERLLDELSWEQPGLPESVAEVLSDLARYREEGKRLFPVVFLTHDLNQLLTDVSGSSPLALGSGTLGPHTVRRALKQCAPLGEGRSWVIYLLVRNGELEFGVFRAPPSPLEPTALERLRQLETASPSAIGIAYLAENILELRGSRKYFRYIFLSGVSADLTQPMEVTRNFINALTHDADFAFKKPMKSLYYRVLMDVMQTWHGTLAVVVQQGRELPRTFADGIVLPQPIRILEYVERFLKNPSFESAAELQAVTHLIRGMLSSDGVMVFTTDGSLLAYNVFVRHHGEMTLPFQVAGGARRRTFETLKQLVGTEIIAAFYRSQDGSAKCATSLNESC